VCPVPFTEGVFQSQCKLSSSSLAFYRWGRTNLNETDEYSHTLPHLFG